MSEKMIQNINVLILKSKYKTLYSSQVNLFKTTSFLTQTSMNTKLKQSTNNREKTFKTQYGTQCSYPLNQFPHQNQNDQQKQNYDQEFKQVYHQIVQHDYFTKISKHQKIRINKWLTKLSNISTNNLWKKNRNNYIKLIRLMFDCEVIVSPFLMMPPERDLHKLTTHQINVIIDQVDKTLDQKESKSAKPDKNVTSRDKFNKVSWTQESAYIDHTQNSVQKHKNKNETKFPYQSGSITANFNKPAQNQRIPPRYPGSSLSKSPINQTKNQSNKNQENYFIKHIKQSSSPSNYFKKKERFNTFQTEQINQQDDQIVLKNSIQKGFNVLQKDIYDIQTEAESNQHFQTQSKQAINILKCGFRLLQKIPLTAIEQNSLPEISSFRKILNQNKFLKNQFQKQTTLLELFTSRLTNSTALNQIDSLNNTRKIKNQKKKMKLTLLSQLSNRS